MSALAEERDRLIKRFYALAAVASLLGNQVLSDQYFRMIDWLRIIR